MDSIAVTKPDMGVLSRKGLVLSPFGTLAQTFSEALLARAGFQDGHYPFVPLDLLEEGEEGEAAAPAPVQPVIQVDLNLVLEALRQSGSRTEREKATERIVERVLRLREREILPPSAAAPRRPASQGQPVRIPAQQIMAVSAPTAEQQAQAAKDIPLQTAVRQDITHTAPQTAQRGTVTNQSQPPRREAAQVPSQNVRQDTPRTIPQAAQRGTVTNQSQPPRRGATQVSAQDVRQDTDHSTPQTAPYGTVSNQNQPPRREITQVSTQTVRQDIAHTTSQAAPHGTVFNQNQSAPRGTASEQNQPVSHEAAQVSTQDIRQSTAQTPVQTAAHDTVPIQDRQPRQAAQGDVSHPAQPGEEPRTTPAAAATQPEQERLYALQQNFYSTVNQHIQFTANLQQAQAARPEGRMPRQTAPGGLSRRAMAFSRQLQKLREEGQGAALPSETPAAPHMTGAEAPQLPGWEKNDTDTQSLARQDVRRIAPTELSYLEDGGENTAPVSQNSRTDTAALRQAVEQTARQIGQALAGEVSALRGQKTVPAVRTGGENTARPTDTATREQAHTPSRREAPRQEEQREPRSPQDRGQSVPRTQQAQSARPYATDTQKANPSLTSEHTPSDAGPHTAAGPDGIHRASTSHAARLSPDGREDIRQSGPTSPDRNTTPQRSAEISSGQSRGPVPLPEGGETTTSATAASLRQEQSQSRREAVLPTQSTFPQQPEAPREGEPFQHEQISAEMAVSPAAQSSAEPEAAQLAESNPGMAHHTLASTIRDIRMAAGEAPEAEKDEQPQAQIPAFTPGPELVFHAEDSHEPTPGELPRRETTQTTPQGGQSSTASANRSHSPAAAPRSEQGTQTEPATEPHPISQATPAASQPFTGTARDIRTATAKPAEISSLKTNAPLETTAATVPGTAAEAAGPFTSALASIPTTRPGDLSERGAAPPQTAAPLFPYTSPGVELAYRTASEQSDSANGVSASAEHPESAAHETAARRPATADKRPAGQTAASLPMTSRTPQSASAAPAVPTLSAAQAEHPGTETPAAGSTAAPHGSLTPSSGTVATTARDVRIARELPAQPGLAAGLSAEQPAGSIIPAYPVPPLETMVYRTEESGTAPASQETAQSHPSGQTSRPAATGQTAASTSPTVRGQAERPPAGSPISERGNIRGASEPLQHTSPTTVARDVRTVGGLEIRPGSQAGPAASQTSQAESIMQTAYPVPPPETIVYRTEEPREAQAAQSFTQPQSGTGQSPQARGNAPAPERTGLRTAQPNTASLPGRESSQSPRPRSPAQAAETGTGEQIAKAPFALRNFQSRPARFTPKDRGEVLRLLERAGRTPLSTAARDVRTVSPDLGVTPGETESDAPSQALQQAMQSPPPETMVYRTQETPPGPADTAADRPTAPRTAQTAGEQSSVSETIRAAMAQQTQPDTYTWLRERLSGRMHLSQPRIAGQQSQPIMGQTAYSSGLPSQSPAQITYLSQQPPVMGQTARPGQQQSQSPTQISYLGQQSPTMGQTARPGQQVRTAAQMTRLSRQPRQGAASPGTQAFSQSVGTAASAARSAGNAAGAAPEPLDLTYATQQPQSDAAVQPQQGQQSQQAQRGPMDSDYVRSLPDWAQRFLREGAPQTAAAAAAQMGTARNIATLPQPEKGESFEWTAPNYQAPAPVTYRERPQRQEQTQAQAQQSVRISDAEIRRTADRVYQIIEDRIRRERRRLGL